jgi:hypothetical protein
MSGREPRAKPELIEFLAGYAGPPPIEYRGGRVKVIAAFVYSDGVLIEWLIDQVPDLSWMPDPEESGEGTSTFFPQFRDQPLEMDRMRRFRRLTSFWDDATLIDDLGGQYQSTWGDAQGAGGTGYKGHKAFSPAPPREARELTVLVHELAIKIALRADTLAGP